MTFKDDNFGDFDPFEEYESFDTYDQTEFQTKLVDKLRREIENGQFHQRSELAEALVQLAREYSSERKYDDAINCIDEASRVCQELVDEGQIEFLASIGRGKLLRIIELRNKDGIGKHEEETSAVVNYLEELVRDGESRSRTDLATALLMKVDCLTTKWGISGAAIAAQDRAIRIWQELLDDGETEYCEQLVGATIIRAQMKSSVGDKEGALQDFVEAEKIARNAIEKGQIEVRGILMETLLKRAEFLSDTGFKDKVIPLFKEALELATNLIDEGNETAESFLPFLTVRFGLFYQKYGEHEKARKQLQNACRNYDSQLKRGVGDVYVTDAMRFAYANATMHLGCVLSDLREYEKARKKFEKAVEIFRKIKTEERSYINYCICVVDLNCADSLLLSGKTEEAAEKLETAINALKQRIDSGFPNLFSDLASAYRKMTIVQHELKNFDASFEWAEKMISLLFQMVDDGGLEFQPHLAAAYQLRANLHDYYDKYDNAINDYLKAVRIVCGLFEEEKADDNPRIPLVLQHLHQLGALYRSLCVSCNSLNDLEQTYKFAAAELEVCRNLMKYGEPAAINHLLQILVLFAETCEDMDKWDETDALFNEALLLVRQCETGADVSGDIKNAKCETDTETNAEIDAEIDVEIDVEENDQADKPLITRSLLAPEMAYYVIQRIAMYKGRNGKYEEAYQMLNEAIERGQKVLTPDFYDEQFYSCLTHKAHCCAEVRQDEEAVSAYEQAIEYLTRTADFNLQQIRKFYANELYNYGILRKNRKEWKLAVTLFEQSKLFYQSLCISEDFPFPGNPEGILKIMSLLSYSVEEFDVEQNPGANLFIVADGNKNTKTFVKLTPEPEEANSNENNNGSSKSSLFKVDTNAQVSLENLGEITKDKTFLKIEIDFDAADPQFIEYAAQCCNHIGECYSELNDFDNAVSVYNETLRHYRILERLKQPYPSETGKLWTMYELARVLADQRKQEETLKLVTEIVDRWKKRCQFEQIRNENSTDAENSANAESSVNAENTGNVVPACNQSENNSENNSVNNTEKYSEENGTSDNDSLENCANAENGFPINGYVNSSNAVKSIVNADDFVALNYSLGLLAWAANLFEDNVTSELAARDSVAIAEKIISTGKDYRQAYAKDLEFLGCALIGLNRFDEGIEKFNFALEIIKELTSEGVDVRHPHCDLHGEIGLALLKQGEYEKAFEFFDGVTALFEETYLDQGKQVRYCITSLYTHRTIVLGKLDRYEDALGAAARAIEIIEQWPPEIEFQLRPNLAEILTHRAYAKRKLGDTETAFADHDEAVRLLEECVNEGWKFVFGELAVALSARSAAYQETDQLEKAEQDRNRAIEIFEERINAGEIQWQRELSLIKK
ncbi:MAG: hypothetical protein ACRC2T_14345 [Thermoguttaceae bacterium]